jgi:hypothetical protein
MGKSLDASTRWSDLAGADEPLESGKRWSGGDPFPGPLAGAELKTLGKALFSVDADPHEPCYFGIWSDWSMLSQSAGTFKGRPSVAARMETGSQGSVASNISGLSDPKPLGDRFYRVGTARLEQVVCDGVGDELFRELLWGPDLFWARDGSWFVHSDVELDSTLVGGDVDLCTAIIAQGDLEALSISVDAEVF